MKKKNSRKSRWLLIATGIAAVLGLGYILYFICTFSLFDPSDGKHYSKTDLINNYRKNRPSLSQLKAYYTRLVPEGKTVYVEFDNDKMLGKFEVSQKASDGIHDDYYVTYWNQSVTSAHIDSILRVLGWSRETLREIKRRLDKADCISVMNGEPLQAGYKRSEMGMYFYDLFSRPLSDSLKQAYNDSCTHLFYNDTVVLEYGGGAVGPQCFPQN